MLDLAGDIGLDALEFRVDECYNPLIRVFPLGCEARHMILHLLLQFHNLLELNLQQLLPLLTGRLHMLSNRSYLLLQ